MSEEEILAATTAADVVSDDEASIAATLPSYLDWELKISEVMACPQDQDLEWININNKDGVDRDLDGFMIQDKAGHQVELSGLIEANQLLQVFLPQNILNNSGDEIFLLSPVEELIDQVSFEVCVSGESFIFGQDELISTEIASTDIVNEEEVTEVEDVSVAKTESTEEGQKEVKDLKIHSSQGNGNESHSSLAFALSKNRNQRYLYDLNSNFDSVMNTSSLSAQPDFSSVLHLGNSPTPHKWGVVSVILGGILLICLVVFFYYVKFIKPNSKVSVTT